MNPPVVTSVRQSVGGALAECNRVVLAVSGGLDSMVLLDAAAATLPAERLVVATFDHGTGSAATRARALVEARCVELGVVCVAGRGSADLSSEASLREARWTFLRKAAAGGTISTAHTEDDQIETVLMRILRGAGARGLAALYAESNVVRPLLWHRRQDVARYARACGVAWIEDPSNQSRRYFRNRVRHDLLPAMRHVRPSIDDELLRIARKAAGWRARLESWAAAHVQIRVLSSTGADVQASSLADMDEASLAILWPAVAARAGLVLDRRGTARLAAFSAIAVERDGPGAVRVGARIQLAGGWTVGRSRDAFQLRASTSQSGGERARSKGAPREAGQPTNDALPLSNEGVTRWTPLGSGGGATRWSFHRAVCEIGAGATDAWFAWLPTDQPLTVRSWRPGDVMAWRAGSAPRKVKRFLSDARITGHERAGWPVVLVGDQIVWIPGVRRDVGFEAATARSGRPALAFVCEYVDR